MCETEKPFLLKCSTFAGECGALLLLCWKEWRVLRWIEWGSLVVFVLDVVAFLAKIATTSRSGMRYSAESVGCGGIKVKKCHHI